MVQRKVMMETVKHDKNIKIWGALSYNRVGHLHNIEGIMDVTKFKHVLIPAGTKYGGFISRWKYIFYKIMIRNTPQLEYGTI